MKSVKEKSEGIENSEENVECEEKSQGNEKCEENK